jgi:hypothetical protein
VSTRRTTLVGHSKWSVVEFLYSVAAALRVVDAAAASLVWEDGAVAGDAAG